MYDQSELWPKAPEPTLTELTEAVKLLCALNRIVPPWIAQHLEREAIEARSQSTPARTVEAEPTNPIRGWRMEVEQKSRAGLVHELFNLQEEVRVLCETHPEASQPVAGYLNATPTPEQAEYGLLQMKLSFLDQLFRARHIDDRLIQQVRSSLSVLQ